MKAKPLAAIVLLLSLILAGAASSPVRDTTTLRSFDANTGKQRWGLGTAELGAASLSEVLAGTSVVVYEERKCTSDGDPYQKGDSRLLAFRARDGSQPWTRSDVGSSDSLSAPSGGVVPSWVNWTFSGAVIPIWLKNHDELRAISITTGRQLWRVGTDGLVPTAGNSKYFMVTTPLGTPLVDEPNRSPGRARVVNVLTGKTAWTTDFGPGTEVLAATMSDVDVAAVVAAGDIPNTRLELFDLKTGEAKVTIPLPAGVTPDTVQGLVPSGGMFILSTITGLSAYNGSNGAHAWDLADYPVVVGRSGVGTGSIVFAQHRSMSGSNSDLDQPDAINATTGAVLWTMPNGLSMLASGESVLAYGPVSPYQSRTAISVARSSDGKTLWHRELERGQVAIGKHSVYIATGCPRTAVD
jgi:outer membrane protein assembly factor BamB